MSDDSQDQDIAYSQTDIGVMTKNDSTPSRRGGEGDSGEILDPITARRRQLEKEQAHKEAAMRKAVRPWELAGRMRDWGAISLVRLGMKYTPVDSLFRKKRAVVTGKDNAREYAPIDKVLKRSEDAWFQRSHLGMLDRLEYTATDPNRPLTGYTDKKIGQHFAKVLLGRKPEYPKKGLVAAHINGARELHATCLGMVEESDKAYMMSGRMSKELATTLAAKAEYDISIASRSQKPKLTMEGGKVTSAKIKLRGFGEFDMMQRGDYERYAKYKYEERYPPHKSVSKFKHNADVTMRKIFGGMESGGVNLEKFKTKLNQHLSGQGEYFEVGRNDAGDMEITAIQGDRRETYGAQDMLHFLEDRVFKFNTSHREAVLRVMNGLAEGQDIPGRTVEDAMTRDSKSELISKMMDDACQSPHVRNQVVDLLTGAGLKLSRSERKSLKRVLEEGDSSSGEYQRALSHLQQRAENLDYLMDAQFRAMVASMWGHELDLEAANAQIVAPGGHDITFGEDGRMLVDGTPLNADMSNDLKMRLEEGIEDPLTRANRKLGELADGIERGTHSIADRAFKAVIHKLDPVIKVAKAAADTISNVATKISATYANTIKGTTNAIRRASDTVKRGAGDVVDGIKGMAYGATTATLQSIRNVVTRRPTTSGIEADTSAVPDVADAPSPAAVEQAASPDVHQEVDDFTPVTHTLDEPLTTATIDEPPATSEPAAVESTATSTPVEPLADDRATA